jgi:hypothetical protein
MPSILIPEDGFTLKGRVEPLPGLHDGVSFTYRPALPARVAAWTKAKGVSAEKNLAADLKLLTEHVTEWDDDAPIDEPTLRRVYYPVLQQMIDHVTGYSASVWEAAEKNSSPGCAS